MIIPGKNVTFVFGNTSEFNSGGKDLAYETGVPETGPGDGNRRREGKGLPTSGRDARQGPAKAGSGQDPHRRGPEPLRRCVRKEFPDAPAPPLYQAFSPERG